MIFIDYFEDSEYCKISWKDIVRAICILEYYFLLLSVDDTGKNIKSFGDFYSGQIPAQPPIIFESRICTVLFILMFVHFQLQYLKQYNTIIIYFNTKIINEFQTFSTNASLLKSLSRIKRISPHILQLLMIKNLSREEYFRKKSIPIPKTPNRLEVPHYQNHLIKFMPKLDDEFLQIRQNSKYEKVNQTLNALQMMNRLEQDLVMAQSKIDDYQQQVQMLQENNLMLEKEIRALNKKIVILDNTISQNEALSNNKYMALQQEYRCMINLNANKIIELNVSYSKLREQTSEEIRYLRTNHKTYIDEVEIKIREMESQSEKYKQQSILELEKAGEENRKLMKKLYQFSRIYKDGEEAKSKLEEQNEQLRNKNMEIRNCYESKICVLQAELNKYKFQYDNEKTEQEKYKYQISGLMQEITFLYIEIEQKEKIRKKLNEVTDQKASLSIRLQRKRQQLNEKDNKISSMANRGKELESQIDWLKIELQKIKIESNSKVKDVMRELQKKYNQERKQIIQSHSNQLNQMQISIKKRMTDEYQRQTQWLQQKIEKLVRENDQIKTKYQQTEILFSQSKIQIQSQVKKNQRQVKEHANELEKVMKESEKVIEGLKQEHLQNQQKMKINQKSIVTHYENQYSLCQQFINNKEEQIKQLKVTLQNILSENSDLITALENQRIKNKGKTEERIKIIQLSKQNQAVKHENIELKSKVSELEESLGDTLRQNNERKKKQKEYESQIEKIQSEHSRCSQNYNKRQQQLESKRKFFEDKYEQLKLQATILEVNNEELKMQNKKQEKSIQVLRQKLHGIQKQNSELKEEYQKMEYFLKQQIQMLEQNLNGAMKKAGEYGEMISRKKQQYDRLLIELKQDYDRDVEEERRKYKELYEKNLRELKSSQMISSQIEKDNINKQNWIIKMKKDHELEISNFQYRISQYERKLVLKQNDNDILDSRNLYLQDQLKTAENKISQLNASMRRYQQQVDKKFIQLQAKYKNSGQSKMLQSENQQLKEKIENERSKFQKAIREEKRKLQNEITQLKDLYETELYESKEEKKEIYKKIGNLETKNYDHQRTISSLEQLIRRMNDDIKNSYQQTQTCGKIIQEQKKIIEELEFQNKQLLQQIQSKIKQLNAYKVEYQKFKVEKTELYERIRKLKWEIDDNEAMGLKWEQEKGRAFDQYERRIDQRLKDIKGQHQKQLKEKQKDIEKLKEKVKKLKEQTEEHWREKYQKLQKENEILSKQNVQKSFEIKKLSANHQSQTSQIIQLRRQLNMYKVKWSQMYNQFNLTNFQLTGDEIPLIFTTEARKIQVNVNSSRTHKFAQNNLGLASDGSTIKLKESRQFVVNQFNENISQMDEKAIQKFEKLGLYPEFNYDDSFSKEGEVQKQKIGDDSSDGVVMDEI